MSWHFLQEAADLFGHRPSSDTASSAPSKSKRSKDQCYSQGSETASSLCFRCGTTSEPSTASLGVERWISSLAGFLAPTSAWPERAQGSTERNPGFGGKWHVSFARCSRVSSLWRTSEPLFPEASTGFSGIWPISGSMRSGIVFERPTWALRTKEKDSSSWPTAQAHDAKGPKTPEQIAKMRAKGFGVRNLNEEAASWQTPATDSFRSRGGDRKDEMGLDRQARTWPTPTSSMATLEDMEQARYAGSSSKRRPYSESSWTTPTANDAKNNASPSQEERNSPALNVQASHHAPMTPTDGLNTSQRAVLNPQFVEALMGWPIGASGLQPLATAGFRRWLCLHGGPCGAESMAETLTQEATT